MQKLSEITAFKKGLILVGAEDSDLSAGFCETTRCHLPVFSCAQKTPCTVAVFRWSLCNCLETVLQSTLAENDMGKGKLGGKSTRKVTCALLVTQNNEDSLLKTPAPKQLVAGSCRELEKKLTRQLPVLNLIQCWLPGTGTRVESAFKIHYIDVGHSNTAGG